MSLAFDVLAYTHRMESVGFSRQQAEALADEQSKLIDERLATKSDIEGLRLANQKDIEALRLATQKDIEALRLATQKDIEAMRLAVKQDIEAMRLAVKQDIEILRKDVEVGNREIIIKLGTMIAIAVGILSTLMHFWK